MVRLRFGFGGGVGAELDHQPSTAFGQQREAFEIHAFATARVDHNVIETFEADRMMLHDLRDVVGTEIDIGPSITSNTRAGGLSTRRQVASRTVTQVPSEPTSERAT